MARQHPAPGIELEHRGAALLEQPRHAARLRVERVLRKPGRDQQIRQHGIERVSVGALIRARLDAALQAQLDDLVAADRERQIGVPEISGRPQELLIERIARELVVRVVVVVDVKPEPVP